MRLHIAGLCSGLSFKWFERNSFSPRFILESFFYLKDWLFDLPTYRSENFMLDSGAFTFINQKKQSKIDWDAYVEKYSETIVRRGIKYFFELDIDSIVGLKEVERLREKLERLTGKKCIPVWHRKRGQNYWLDMLAAYDYVAIGGIVTKEIKRSEHHVFDWFLHSARERQVKVHGLGYTNAKGLKRHRFHSVDSTSWLGSKYGNLYHFDGDSIYQIKKPVNSLMTDYKLFEKQNLKEWMKFQNHAECNL